MNAAELDRILRQGDNAIKVNRGDILTLHNNAIDALEVLVEARNKKESIPANDVIKLCKMVYAIADTVQNLAVENDFLFCF